MAITCRRILFLLAYILICALLPGSTQSTNNGDGMPLIEKDQPKPETSVNKTNILYGLKDVLNKVKNKIYPENTDEIDEEISPTATLNDITVHEDTLPVKETNLKIVDATVTEKNKHTLNNLFTVINLGWNENVVQPQSRKDDVSRIERPSTVKINQLAKDDFIKPDEEDLNVPIKNNLDEDAEKTSNIGLSEEAPTTSNSIISDDDKLNNLSNATDESKSITSTEDPVATDDISNVTDDQSTSFSESALPTEEKRTSAINISYEQVMDTVALVTDITSADGAKTSDGGKIETYSQFTERVSAEKKNGDGNMPVVGKSLPKVKTKNYASQDCGAKLLSANPDAEFPGHVISRNKDEYMLNKCNFETYFVVIELCESIRTQKFDVANFELFSNVPKDMRLYGSHRYPVRDWMVIGDFQGEEGNREVQSFVTDSNEFIKYVKLEVISHYGTEFYCPLSLFRIYGISEFEAIDHLEDDTDDYEEEEIVMTTQAPKVSGWDLKSLVGKVLSVIKRGSISYRSHTEQDEINSFTNNCRSLDSNFAIKTKHCPAQEYLNYILSCYHDEYLTLLQQEAIAASIKSKVLCNLLSQSLCGTPTVPDEVIYSTLCKSSYPCIMLSPKHIFVLCYMTYPNLLRNMSNCAADGLLYISSEAPANNDSIEYKITMVSNDSQTKVPSESIPSIPSEDADKFRSDKANENIDNGKLRYSEEIDDVVHSDHSHEKSLNASTSQEIPTQIHSNEESLKSRSQNISTGFSDGAGDFTSSESKVVSHPNANKESIVVRLSNKIKVLEENMSISNQYLEELSQTYKRQMEDMQRQFNTTITALNKSSQIAYERDLFHHEQIESLEDRLLSTNRTLEKLMQWNDSTVKQIFLVYCILILLEIGLFYAMYRRFDRLLEQKISRSRRRCCCGRQVVQNGNIPGDEAATCGANNMIAADAMCSVNLNGFMERSQKLVRSPQNGIRTRPTEASSLNNCAHLSNLGIEEINPSHPKNAPVQTLSNNISINQNVGLPNNNVAKQVIPFIMDQRGGYQFDYSSGDFNSPVITDYYTAKSHVPDNALQSESNFVTKSGSLPFIPFNCEGFQSYMQWCYQQSLQSATSSDPRSQAGFHLDSDMKPHNPNSTLKLQNTSSGLITQNLESRKKSVDPKIGLTVEDLDSRFNMIDVNSDLKSQHSTPTFEKQESHLKCRQLESPSDTQQVDSGMAALNTRLKFNEIVSIKHDNTKKNKKKKNKCSQK